MDGLEFTLGVLLGAATAGIVILIVTKVFYSWRDRMLRHSILRDQMVHKEEMRQLDEALENAKQRESRRRAEGKRG